VKPRARRLSASFATGPQYRLIAIEQFEQRYGTAVSDPFLGIMIKSRVVEFGWQPLEVGKQGLDGRAGLHGDQRLEDALQGRKKQAN
jgi:hypothetical protein